MHSEPKKSVLVTGGRGFIGRAVVKLLRRSGYPVISLDRSAAPANELRGWLEIEGDVTEGANFRSVVRAHRIHSIIHLAAILPTAAQRDPVTAYEVNFKGGRTVVGEARSTGVHRLVFGSSLSVYGTYPRDRVVSESDRAAPEDSYGAAKSFIEGFGQTSRERDGGDFVSLRIGRVVGAGSNSVTSAWRSQIFELLKSEQPAEICIPYRPAERILVVHVDDVAEMLLALLSASRTEHAIYNAPCESILVGDLKRVVESLNPYLTVKLGDDRPLGNPQMLDFSRFQKEFTVKTIPIFDRLRKAAGKQS
jgi:nucleoside-diphosphate-sugar epimerase